MDKVLEAIDMLDANLTMYEYFTLGCAILEAREFLPDSPRMSVIWTRVKERKHIRSEKGVAQCLVRAVKRIYENADRQVLASYNQCWLTKKPAPHEFIYVVALKLYGDTDSSTIVVEDDDYLCV